MEKFNHRVLVVEDEAIAQDIAKDILDELGCQMDLAETGEDALRLIRKNFYNLVLMDIGIFDMDGINVAKKIRQLESNMKNVPIAAVTAHTFGSLKRRAEELGFIDYLDKPLTFEHCRRILQSLPITDAMEGAT